MSGLRVRRALKAVLGALWFTPLAPLLILWSWAAGSRANRRLRELADSGRWPWLMSPKEARQTKEEPPAGFNRLAGALDGFRVIVSPGETRAVIEIELEPAPPLMLSTRPAGGERPPDGMQVFSLGAPFDEAFRTRFAAPEVVERLRARGELARRGADFVSRHLWRLQYLILDKGRIYCRLSCGEPFFVYVPTRALDDMVPELVALARAAARAAGSPVSAH